MRGTFAERSKYNQNVEFRLKSIDLLENEKGKMVHNIVVTLNEDQLRQAGMIKDFINDTVKENVCELYFNIHDEEHNQHILMKSKFNVPLTKEFITFLEDSEMSYEVNRKI